MRVETMVFKKLHPEKKKKRKRISSMSRYGRQRREERKHYQPYFTKVALMHNVFPCYLTFFLELQCIQEELGQGLKVTLVTLKFQCVGDSLHAEVLTEISLHCS